MRTGSPSDSAPDTMSGVHRCVPHGFGRHLTRTAADKILDSAGPALVDGTQLHRRNTSRRGVAISRLIVTISSRSNRDGYGAVSAFTSEGEPIRWRLECDRWLVVGRHPTDVDYDGAFGEPHVGRLIRADEPPPPSTSP